MAHRASDTLLSDEVAFQLKAIRELCDEFDVASLEVFGSASVGPFDPIDSDVDLMVEFGSEFEYGWWGENVSRFEDRLGEILERPVDVVTPAQLRNPYFVRSVNRSRRLLFGRRPDANPDTVVASDDNPADDRTLKRLEDIRGTAEALINWSDGPSSQALDEDVVSRLFVERCFEILGQAALLLRNDASAVFERLSDGQHLIELRDAVVHGETDVVVFWNAIKQSMAEIHAEAAALITEMNCPPTPRPA